MGETDYQDSVDPRFLTPEAILTKAIEKAIANGFNLLGRWKVGNRRGWRADLQREIDEPYILESKARDKAELFQRELAFQQLIFDHDFAKALWDKPFPGTNIPATNEVNMEEIPTWKYHLQQMVVADDPIKYLGDHLND